MSWIFYWKRLLRKKKSNIPLLETGDTRKCKTCKGKIQRKRPAHLQSNILLLLCSQNITKWEKQNTTDLPTQSRKKLLFKNDIFIKRKQKQ